MNIKNLSVTSVANLDIKICSTGYEPVPHFNYQIADCLTRLRLISVTATTLLVRFVNDEAKYLTLLNVVKTNNTNVAVAVL